MALLREQVHMKDRHLEEKDQLLSVLLSAVGLAAPSPGVSRIS